MANKKYKVPVVWSMMGYLRVDAESAEEAIRQAKEIALTCPLPDNASYVEDSFEVDTEGSPLEILECNTVVHYLYRDASNYKVHNEAVVKGCITEEEIDRILVCLIDGEYFYPHSVGLPEKKFGDYYEDDPDWFELSRDGFSVERREPTVDLTVEELVAAFENNKGNMPITISQG